jgi:hypothetical protein
MKSPNHRHDRSEKLPGQPKPRLCIRNKLKQEGNLMPKFTWEPLDASPDTRRAKVPGGWMVMIWAGDGSGITFYPDPNHSWNGGSLP